MLLTDLLNICHDLEAAAISILVLHGSHGRSHFSTPILSLAFCRATASIDFWFVDFMIRESASRRHAPTNIHRPDGKPVWHQQCKAIKPIDPSLQVLSDLAVGVGGQTTPVWSYPEMMGKRRRQLPHLKLASTSQGQWDAFFSISRQVRPTGVTRYRTSRIMCSMILGPRGLRASRGIQALASNLSLRTLRSRKLRVGCRVVGVMGALSFEVFVSPM